MFYVGCHLSAAKGFAAMGKTALQIGANTFQFFTRNPRGGAAKAISQKDISDFLSLAEKNHFGVLLAHAPYTLNAASADAEVRRFAFEAMSDDLKRMEYVPHNYYNFHPGSHVGQGAAEGIKRIAELLNKVLTKDQTTTVLLETMAGKGSEIGRSFEELRSIIDLVELSEKVGVCLDTCHVYDAGYDIAAHLDEVLNDFDHIIGLPRLKAIHLNDTKNPFASHKDRHEKLGQGFLGEEALIRVVNHPKLRELPFYLETPNELEGYAAEIALLKKRRSKEAEMR
ncbi:MAG: deoxyribonuclease IV [Alphaproteobacteria bacterium]|nr:deoxyribonuclease IV [Alphaproteobacteria bacterium]